MERRVVVVENEKFDAEIAHEVLGGVAEVRTTEEDTVEGVVAAAQGADALIPWYVPINAAMLERLDSLSVVGMPGTGIGDIDLEAATAHDVTVVNAPTYAADEVSSHAMAMLLACARSLFAFDGAVREGVWNRGPGEPIHRLRGRTLGLLAFGDIARRTAEKAQSFGLDVIAYDPYADPDAMTSRGVTLVDFDDLLGRSDLLSVHAPLTSQTRGVLDESAFAAMGEGVIVVNTGRGGVIEEAALLDALDDGTVGAAGLDVFESEPLRDSPLTERDDVILSPHVAWYSEDSRRDVIRDVAKDVRGVFEGKEPDGLVDRDTDWT
jgi:D-3-phosphoglycerate dehydrogenase